MRVILTHFERENFSTGLSIIKGLDNGVRVGGKLELKLNQSNTSRLHNIFMCLRDTSKIITKSRHCDTNLWDNNAASQIITIIIIIILTIHKLQYVDIVHIKK